MAGFKARARALDMLGRQQIAGIPTAISELFKNAYDAYADNVVVDYFRSDGLLVLRDDGFGMTRDEFENRWLTIGTESKLGGLFGIANPYIPKDKESRVLMGEKGIGRLAIAMLGSQVLVITRAVRDEERHNYVVSFINWKLFECPGLNLDEIYIPVKEFSSFPTSEEVNEIIKESIEHIKSFSSKIEKSFFRTMIEDLEKLYKMDVIKTNKYLEKPATLNEDSSGTHFYVYPSNSMITKDLDVSGNSVETDAPELKKMLIGFTDNQTPGHKENPLKTFFRDHKYPEYYEDTISDTNFFTLEEFLNADHIFEGNFDEYGQFNGRVVIYGEERKVNYQIPWNNKGKKTTCGPFEIALMNIQGNTRESNLSSETHNLLMDKLYKFGGFYVYKNGIRVLPYGDNRNDFLGIERRRNIRAGTYHWSIRRMFGVIRLTSKDNSALQEKAGREGYQHNDAYHEFRDILINFLLQTAKDFFTDGMYSDFYLSTRDENIKRDERLKKEEKTKKGKQKKFISSLNDINKKIELGYFEEQLEEVISQLELDLKLFDTLKNPESNALNLLTLEKNTLNKYRKINQELLLSKPKEIGFSKKVEEEYFLYTKKSTKHESILFKESLNKIQNLIALKSEEIKVELDRRYRIEQSLELASKDAKKVITTSVKEADSLLNDVTSKVTKTTKESLKNIEEVIRGLNIDVSTTDFNGMSEEEIASWRIRIEDKILTAMKAEKDELETIKILLDNVNWEKDNEGNIISYVDVMQATDSRMAELIEKSDLDTDLAQLGMAIHVINHEFDSSIKVVRDNLRRLKGWADVNTGLTGIYKGIKDSFEHLDSYLTLFTPLNRRLQRKKTEVRGSEIEEFLDKLFADRFKRHNIELKASKKFRQTLQTTYPSTLYPVFVNIVDNATYWVKGKNEVGIISLDADDLGYIISNNGSEMLESDRETIFEMGFTRKPGGRGLGLHIAKDVLSEQNMDIEVIKPIDNYNVSFKIFFKKD